jgi:hypothetical protein
MTTSRVFSGDHLGAGLGLSAERHMLLHRLRRIKRIDFIDTSIARTGP